MSIEVKVPQLPESVADAVLVGWHKKVGDAVARDENLADLETDKVVLEVPAPADGVLKELKVEGGATVTSGDLLAVLEEGAAPAAGASDAAKTAAPAAASDAATTAAPATAAPAAAPAAEPEAAEHSAKGLSPSVRRLVEEHDLDAGSIRGSGRDGRVTKADVMQHIEQQASAPAAAAPASTAAPTAAPAAAPEVPAATGARVERRVPMTRLRARIAQRMVDAQHTAAILTSFNEVDLSEVKNLRSRYRDAFEKEHGVRLGFMSFFIKAAIEALRRFPVVNASVEGNDVIYHEFYDIGVAVSTERGLMVPVLKGADEMSFAQVEQTISTYAKSAREGSISLETLTGGTFTITNGGVFGSLISTPILNPPQSAILGMHTIQDRPMAVNGEVKIRPMMYIALSYDHRIVDGREAVQFLVAVKNALEDPARLMLQI